MKDFECQIIDALEGKNLDNDVIQRFPAYLTIYTPESEFTFSISLDSPEIKHCQKVTGTIKPGSKYLWRIPLTDEKGDWQLSIIFDNQKKGRYKSIVEEVITFSVNPELFEYTIDEVEEEDIYLTDITRALPSCNDIEFIDETSKLVEIDAHWLEINSEMNLMRYIYQDDRKSIKERFVPIFLVHGFYSDYITWNYIVRYLWDDGFRHIFALKSYDDRLGVKANAESIELVIDEILTITKHTSLIFIGHSLGGLMGRYFVKKINPSKIHLLITAGAPHLCGLNRFWGKIFILLKNAKMTELDITLRPSSSLTEIKNTINEADFYQQTMINVCGTFLRGGDGGFKLKDNLVPDMRNVGVNSIHMSINKNEDFYKIVNKAIFGKSIFYKIRMLYINPISTPVNSPKIFLLIKPKSENDKLQRFPVKGFFELGKEEPYIPESTMIAYVNSSNYKKKLEKLVIQVKNDKNQLLVEKVFLIPLGQKKAVSDHFKIDTSIGYSIQFVSYSYKLTYD